MLLSIAVWRFVYGSYFVFYVVYFIRYETGNLLTHSELYERAACCSGKDLSLDSGGTLFKATGYSGSSSGVMT